MAGFGACAMDGREATARPHTLAIQTFTDACAILTSSRLRPVLLYTQVNSTDSAMVMTTYTGNVIVSKPAPAIKKSGRCQQAWITPRMMLAQRAPTRDWSRGRA